MGDWSQYEQTTNKFSPKVRERAIRMVLDHEAEHPPRWAAVLSIAAKIGCAAATLHDWVKKTEIDSGRRAGLRKASAYFATAELDNSLKR